MKLYYFNRREVVSPWTKEPRMVFEAEAVEKEKTYIVTRKGSPFGLTLTDRVRKETMIVSDCCFFLALEEAKRALLETIQSRAENDRRRANELLANAERLEKILNEVE